MQNSSGNHSGRSVVRRISLALAISGAALLSGCATSYVDTATKEIPAASMKKPEQPRPVQLAFEFQSKGAPNARATNFLKEDVTKQVAESGLFSKVTTEPTPGASLLSVTLNNIPLTDDAASKGFVTGLTFGLAGSAVSDGYVCTVSYLPAGQSAAIVKTARHAIHTTVGNANPPPGAVKSESIAAAVHQMTRDVLSNALKELSDDASFH
ncbi:hypothetical protein CupriaWKF_28755 [Cupriavidus sp. WKF15]|uniref:hypothetical protein n=1 Tax=Cupriavidus sp. WKF15 TaxID=3032282 RepID=UPI0023E16828|nr:hypothetical protein [Cupriavidus sp. WKF15]WER48752.1 hypothetical protein CupriaWKF_28755 [Cupriavidus sp. WKF15]